MSERGHAPETNAPRGAKMPLIVRDPALPKAQGAYDPAHERDACGVGFIADMHDRRSHAIVAQGLKILENLDHRGAVGADPKMGDGCGILTQIPHAFFAEECSRLGFELPPAGHYAIAQLFLPKAEQPRRVIEGSSPRRSPPRACRSSAGATCRSIPPTSARRCSPPSRATVRSSSAAPAR